MSTFELRRGADRGRTRTDWLDSRHSFAFGSHYDPDNLSFGPLLAFNEDILQPGPGYPVHAHRDTEILTWVLAGALVHEDSSGNSSVISTGQLHYLSAGSGIQHTERSAGDELVRLVQMWLSPDAVDAEPCHQRLDVSNRLRPGALVPIAAGAGSADTGPGVLLIRQPAATLWVARLDAGDAVPLPAAALLHLYVARGSVTVGSPAGELRLAAGDALRVTAAAAERLLAVEPAELLVWQFAG